ncbi:unnamed protein product, partial [Amoebophrya sp. A120]
GKDESPRLEPLAIHFTSLHFTHCYVDHLDDPFLFQCLSTKISFFMAMLSTEKSKMSKNFRGRACRPSRLTGIAGAPPHA